MSKPSQTLDKARHILETGTVVTTVQRRSSRTPATRVSEMRAPRSFAVSAWWSIMSAVPTQRRAVLVTSSAREENERNISPTCS